MTYGTRPRRRKSRTTALVAGALAFAAALWAADKPIPPLDYEPGDLAEFAKHPAPAVNIWWAAAHMDEARDHMAKRNTAEANRALDAAESNLRAAWSDLLANGWKPTTQP